MDYLKKNRSVIISLLGHANVIECQLEATVYFVDVSSCLCGVIQHATIGTHTIVMYVVWCLVWKVSMLYYCACITFTYSAVTDSSSSRGGGVGTGRGGGRGGGGEVGVLVCSCSAAGWVMLALAERVE